MFFFGLALPKGRSSFYFLCSFQVFGRYIRKSVLNQLVPLLGCGESQRFWHQFGRWNDSCAKPRATSKQLPGILATPPPPIATLEQRGWLEWSFSSLFPRVFLRLRWVCLPKHRFFLKDPKVRNHFHPKSLIRTPKP